MAGRPGRSGRPKQFTVQDHILRGSYNATKHGPKPSPITLALHPREDAIPATLIDGLQPRGRRFVESCFARYEGWSPVSLELLYESGRLLDELATLRGKPGERAAQKVLLSVLAGLQLRD